MKFPTDHFNPNVPPSFLTPFVSSFSNSPQTMGNALGGRKRTAKIMKIDGTTFRLKPPVTAGGLLREHLGYDLLNSEEVKRLGVRAQPLSPDQPLNPGKLYFLVELPRLSTGRAPRRAWSGALHVSAKDRLENLKLTRRSLSDLSLAKSLRSDGAVAEQTQEGAVRLRLKLPRAQVEKLMEESGDPAEVAEKIVELFVAAPPPPPSQAVDRTTRPARKEKRTRFLTMAEEVIV